MCIPYLDSRLPISNQSWVLSRNSNTTKKQFILELQSTINSKMTKIIFGNMSWIRGFVILWQNRIFSKNHVLKSCFEIIFWDHGIGKTCWKHDFLYKNDLFCLFVVNQANKCAKKIKYSHFWDQIMFSKSYIKIRFHVQNVISC